MTSETREGEGRLSGPASSTSRNHDGGAKPPDSRDVENRNLLQVRGAVQGRQSLTRKKASSPRRSDRTVLHIQDGPKKVSQRNLHITSSNTGRFSKFLHYNILQEICNKTVIKYPTSP